MRESEFFVAELKYEFFILLAREVHISGAFDDLNRRSFSAGFTEHQFGKFDRAIRREPDRTAVLKLYLGAPISVRT